MATQDIRMSQARLPAANTCPLWYMRHVCITALAMLQTHSAQY